MAKLLTVCLIGIICGISGLGPVVGRLGEDRIVGGVEVTKNELPYQVSLQQNEAHFCGGSIYNAKYIITAAHCVLDLDIVNFSVVAGEHNLNVDDNTEQRRSVGKVVVHPQYGGEVEYENDIAILELDEELTLNAAVAVIKLPKSGQVPTGTGTVSGWGTTTSGEGATLSNILKKAEVPIITDEKCKVSYPDAITDDMICAGFDEGGHDSCQGDSGGPLAVGSGEATYLAGIVSWGEGCALPDKPGVYTEVSYFIDFIEENTTNASSKQLISIIWIFALAIIYLTSN